MHNSSNSKKGKTMLTLNLEMVASLREDAAATGGTKTVRLCDKARNGNPRACLTLAQAFAAVEAWIIEDSQNYEHLPKWGE
jgi:hypothetical protein